MKPTVTLLRLLVLVAGVLWLSRAQEEPQATQPCQSFTPVSGLSCPAGCTNSTYATVMESGVGYQREDLIEAPCGDPKKGQTCVQPFAFEAVTDFNCCTIDDSFCIDSFECCSECCSFDPDKGYDTCNNLCN